jgi:hypothetical protein
LPLDGLAPSLFVYVVLPSLDFGLGDADFFLKFFVFFFQGAEQVLFLVASWFESELAAFHLWDADFALLSGF